MAANLSSDDAQMHNQIYGTYKDAGPSAMLILPALLLCAIAILGMSMNGFVLYVTVKTKTLHGPTNFLLALLCSFECCHQAGHFIFLFIVATGINFIPIVSAIWIELIPLFGLNAALMAMACTAVDRLLAILADKFRDRLGIWRYLAIHIVVTVLYGSYHVYYLYTYALDNQDIHVTGCITEIMTGQSGKTFFMFTAVLCTLSAICYFIVWIVIKTKSYVSQETSARLFKSLVLILCVNIGGYLVNLSICQVLLFICQTQLSANQIQLWLLSFISTALLNLCVAANGPILFANSQEYRTAFCANLQPLMELCKWRAKTGTTIVLVQPMSTSHQQNNSANAMNAGH